MAAIKLFGASQNFFKTLGFYAPPQLNQSCTFNRRNGFYFSAEIGIFVPVTLFFFVEASSAYEYSDSFYMISVSIAMTIYFTEFFKNIGPLLKLVENYEKFIAKRKC